MKNTEEPLKRKKEEKIIMSEIRKLNCGLRVVLEQIPYLQSVTAGVWVKAGCVDENDGETGISHFIEHMMFKGTAKRTARQIASDADALGAQMNAFTSKESTCYYIKSLTSNVDKACEIIIDMLTGSLFAGIAFSYARLGNVHAMSHPVSAFFDVPHGVANAVLLPVIAEYNALADHGRYLKIYNYISEIPAYADEFEPMMLVGAIRELTAAIGIPASLTDAIRQAAKGKEVTAEEIESKIVPMAVDAMKSGNIAVNPRASRQQDIEALYRKAL